MDSTAIATISISALLLLLFPFFFLRSCTSKSKSITRRTSPSSLPFIGHLHHLLSSSPPHHVFARLADELQTSILVLRLGQVPTVVVSSPDLAREILKTHDHKLASRPSLLSGQYLSFGCSDITFSPLGPYWRQARRICVSELLAPRRVASFASIRKEEIDLLLRSIAAAGKDEAVDMSEKFFALANGVLCRVAFGKRFEDEGKKKTENGKKKKKKNMVEVLQESQSLFAGFDAGEFFPGIVGEVLNAATGLRRRLETNQADLRAVGTQIINEHKKSGTAEAGKDFVDVLLRVKEGGDLEVPLTDDNLIALVMDMFVAGTDTTSATLEWTMTELARHPAAMAEAQSEVRSAVAARCGGAAAATPEESDLPHLRFLKSAVKETLRLHAPVPLLVPREAVEACTVGGAAISPGTRVLINVFAMGRNPALWDRPLDFSPARFLEKDDAERTNDFTLLPFGGGRRGCPGSTFALATAELALAKLLYHFDWSLPAGTSPDDVDMEELFGLATRKNAPLVLVPKVNSSFSLLC